MDWGFHVVIRLIIIMRLQSTCLTSVNECNLVNSIHAGWCWYHVGVWCPINYLKDSGWGFQVAVRLIIFMGLQSACLISINGCNLDISIHIGWCCLYCTSVWDLTSDGVLRYH